MRALRFFRPVPYLCRRFPPRRRAKHRGDPHRAPGVPRQDARTAPTIAWLAQPTHLLQCVQRRAVLYMPARPGVPADRASGNPRHHRPLCGGACCWRRYTLANASTRPKKPNTRCRYAGPSGIRVHGNRWVPGRQIPAIAAERNEKERWHELCSCQGSKLCIRANGEHTHGNTYVDV